MSTTSTPVQITEDHKRQFRENGFFLLESVMSEEHLEILRNEAQNFIDKIDAEMTRQGKDVLGINHRGKRYFIGNRFMESERMHEFIFSDLTAEICRATLGPEAYLFNEQYVIKCAEVGMKFGWHQDSGYVGHDHRPYMSLWCPLDDVDESNGTVYMLPYSKAGTTRRLEHQREEETNDLIGYRGADPGVPINAPAGSIAVFSSTTFHRSGPNTTNRMRRVYLSQYSAEPILSKDGTKNWGQAIHFLHEGKRVR